MGTLTRPQLFVLHTQQAVTCDLTHFYQNYYSLYLHFVLDILAFIQHFHQQAMDALDARGPVTSLLTVLSWKVDINH